MVEIISGEFTKGKEKRDHPMRSRSVFVPLYPKAGGDKYTILNTKFFQYFQVLMWDFFFMN
jgi:hypothetical protein